MTRDALVLGGGVLFHVGLWMIYPPLALLVAGIVAAGVGWLLPREE